MVLPSVSKPTEKCVFVTQLWNIIRIAPQISTVIPALKYGLSLNFLNIRL